MDKKENSIVLNDISFSWKKQNKPILNINRFVVKKAEKIFIQGPSGIGKSTLLAIISGVLRPDSGEILVADEELTKMSGSELDSFRADHCGYIFQLFNLIPYLSVLENIILPCHFSRIRKERALSSGNTLREEAERLLAKLSMEELLYDKKITELSVGQQQRVAAARALIGSPEIILADEPTSSLDMDNKKSFIEFLSEECSIKGSTLLFVSHDPLLSDFFDKKIQFSEINR